MLQAIAAVVVVLLAAGLSLMAWIVKTLLTTAATLASTSERLDDIEQRGNDRFQRLEGVVFEPAWRNRR